jgi:ABC-type uncharacterized transport system permease subunit
MSSGIVFHAAAALAYTILGYGQARRLLLAKGIEPADGALKTQTRLALLGALALHAAGLAIALFGAGQLFVGWALALSAGVWLGLVAFWLESLFIRVDGLQLLLLPAAVLATLLAALFPQGVVVPHANSNLLRAHLIIALIAYGLTTVAAVQAGLMALLDRRLRRPQQAPAQRGLVARVLDAQPPLLAQEHLLFRVIWIGFAALTLTLASGSAASLSLTGRILPFDHKTVFTLLSWLTFGVLLAGRALRGWRGRAALRWTLAGFVFVFLAYTGSRFVLEMILHR